MEPFSYRVIPSGRSSIAIEIRPDGEVLVRCPRQSQPEEIRAFVRSKAEWIETHLRRQAAVPRLPPLTRGELDQLARAAKSAIPERAAHFAPLAGVDYGRITIRSQRSRWGSCSSKGNLNFNCLLMLAPAQVLDYVVVHELCHRKEMNHSARFWAEVARVLPEYRVGRQWLKDNGPALIGRLR